MNLLQLNFKDVTDTTAFVKLDSIVSKGLFEWLKVVSALYGTGAYPPNQAQLENFHALLHNSELKNNSG